MFKKTLLFMLLMTLLAPWAAYAQTFTVYETDGTAYNEYVPFQGYNADGAQHNQMIYPATDLSTDMVGKSITQMVFYIQSWGSSGTTQGNWTVSLGETTATTLSGLDNTTSLTQVYEGQMVYNSEHTTMTITFDDAYTYQGGNLLVDFNHAAAGWRRIYFYGKTVTGASYCYGSQRNFLDKVTFSYETPATCAKPNGLEATLTAGNGSIATMSWTENGTATNWVLEYGTASDFTGATSMTTGFTVSGTTVTANLTGLTAEAKYYARVKADCGGGEVSDWSSTCEFTPTNALTLTVYDDPSTLTTNGYIPLGSGNQDYYNHSEYIIPAAELASINGATLNSIKLYANYTLTTGSTTVYIREVKDETFSSTTPYGVAGSTTVYTGALTISSTDGMTVVFNEGYDYNGGNLLIGFYKEYVGSYISGSFYGQNVTGASIGGYGSSSPSIAQRNFIPKTTFNYSINPYKVPKNLSVSNVTNTSATVSWNAPASGTPTGYKYQYKPDGGTWNALTSTTALSAPLSGLTASTTYTFQVQAIYAGGESDFASTTFTTECDAFSIDPTAYQYGFETADDMDCWELVNGVTNTAVWDNATLDYNFGYEPARTGDYCFMFFYVDYDDTDPEYQTLISPQLTDLPANGVHVEFYYVGDLGGSGQESFRVGYSTTNKDLSSFTWDTEITDASTAYQRFSANYPQGTKYVAVQHTSDDQYYLFLDDFTFEGAADCLEPSSVLADNITTTGASINWTASGEEVAWDIYVTDDATIVPDDGTTPTYANISTKPYPLPGLTPATTYYVYVRAACKGTETSAWSTPAIFHTECEGMDLPYGPYGFEDGTLSVCWNVINTNTSYNSVSVSASNANLGTHCLSFFRGAATGDLVAVLPEVGAYDLSDYQFEFSAKGSYAGYEIYIGIMTDPDDLTTFVAQGDVITTTTSYAEHKVRFNGYTGTGKYVAIKVVRPSSVTYGTIYVDDIAINPIPSCLEPTALNVTAPTAHGATFAWTAGGSETEWHLYFGKDATAPADDINLKEVTVADSNPFTLTTGLDAETNYYAWVRANCGGTDGYSMWVGPVTFTTDITCPAPTGLAASEITAHTAKLSWTGTSDSYKVSYRTAAYVSSPVLNEEFSSSTFPSTWSRSSTALTDNVLNGTTTITTSSSGWSTTTYGLGAYNVKMNIYSTNKYWLITPSTTIGTNYILSFDAAITAYNSNSAPTSSNMANANSRFVVLITTDNQATWTILREWNNTGSADVLNNISNTGNNFSIDLTAYAGETVKIAFYGGQTSSGPDCDLHIDNVLIGEAVPAGTWTTKATDASPYQLTGLLAETKYEAKVQGDCGSEGLSQETASIFFTTDIACPAPTGLTATNPKSSAIDLSWTNGGAENWVLAYKKTTDTDFTEVALASTDVTETAGVISYTLGGLDPETNYTVKVRDNCDASVPGDGVSEWTTEVAFSTIAACSAMDPVVSNITHHNATVTWDGESTSGFNVNYREAAYIDGIPEEFSSSSAPEGWTRYSGEWNSDGTGPTSTTTSGWSFGAKNFTNSHAYMNMYSDWKYWLVTPSITVGSNYEMNFDAAYTKYNATTTPDQTGTDDRFVILISTDNKAHWTSLREWNNAGTGDAVLNDLPVTFQPVDPIDLSAFNGQTVYIAFYGASTESNTDNHLRIDNVVIGVKVPAATTWQTQTATATTADLTGLTAGTKYDLKVVPNCDATLESTTIQFTTMSANEKQFITAGDWATATNWLDGEMPTIADNAVIKANAAINNGTVATAKKITFEGSPTPTLTINDGGSLQTDNSVAATVKKHIKGYESANAGTNLGYYLIANPLNSTVYSSNFATVGLTSGTYDLYTWSYSSTDELEWRNYKASTFNLASGNAYLYANEADVDLTFNGTVAANNTEVSKNLNYATTTYQFNGWNLVGNPFVCDAYVKDASSSEIAFYKMNTTGDGFETATGAIKPMEGIFVQATASGQSFKFTRNVPSTSTGKLNVNVAQVVTSRDANRSTDNAIIRFGEGNTLEKFSFSDANVKIYFPQEGKDFAVVNAENEGEMPVNFKAATNGAYTLSFNSENTEFRYLHLIDNMTGNDVDLLATPSYTFNAQTTDYASRFKLVFATGSNNGDNFGFISNGELILTGLTGNETLQVVDALGRVIVSTNAMDRISVDNMAAGVYVLRLINGDNVKTQKIVVK